MLRTTFCKKDFFKNPFRCSAKRVAKSRTKSRIYFSTKARPALVLVSKCREQLVEKLQGLTF